jgi:hypothetical protein
MVTMPGRSILIVEDHADTAWVFARLLQKRGHKTRTAGTAAEARELLEQERFDLLLCDLGLPDADGCDVMRLVSQRQAIPGIALTGFASPEDIEHIEAAGFAAHLVKPIVAERLEELVERFLSRSAPPGAPASPDSRPPA